MNDLSEFQAQACAAALAKMMREKHFSLSTLDAIASTMGRKSSCAGRDYDALRGVHCVDWADMGPELSRMVKQKCLEILGLPPQILEAIRPVETREPAHEPAKRLRLAFWK